MIKEGAYAVVMGRFYSEQLERHREQIREIDIQLFTVEEIRFFRKCNEIKDLGYARISTEHIERYLTHRDKSIRRFIESLPRDG